MRRRLRSPAAALFALPSAPAVAPSARAADPTAVTDGDRDPAPRRRLSSAVHGLSLGISSCSTAAENTSHLYGC